jgi:hypothetical protein
MNAHLRQKVAQYLTAGFPNQLTALREAGILSAGDTAATREAEQFLREAATAVLFVADNDERRLAADRSRGEYREAVEKLADGVVEDIRGCKVASQTGATVQILTAAGRSPYATDPAFFLATLEHGTHPSAYYAGGDGRHTRPTDPVPWASMAAACFAADAKEELERRAEFAALPWM